MTAVLLTAAPPLTERQAMVLEATDDRSATIDAAGLYVLLEHVRNWPSDPAEIEPGSRLMDLAAIENDPKHWRGEVFVIEGTLATIANATLYTPQRRMAHEQWQGLICWHVRGHDGSIYIICLTDPPDVAIAQTARDQGVPKQADQPVRVVGRFYKWVQVENQKSELQRYPVFVARTATLTQPVAAPSRVNPTQMTLLLIVLVSAAYVVARAAFKRKISSGAANAYANLRERRQRDETARDQRDPIDYRNDLPDDPAEAMAALEKERTPPDDPTNTPQENDSWPK